MLILVHYKITSYTSVCEHICTIIILHSSGMWTEVIEKRTCATKVCYISTATIATTLFSVLHQCCFPWEWCGGGGGCGGWRVRGNPRLRTPPPHFRCLCRSWRRSRSHVSSGQLTGVVGDWESRRREGQDGENRGRRAREGGKERVRRGRKRG